MSLFNSTEDNYNDKYDRLDDRSIDLLNFDTSITENNLNIQIQSETKTAEFEKDFLTIPTKTSLFDDLSNISTILKEPIGDDPDDLVGLSSDERVVDKSTFNELKRYHKLVKKDWLKKETDYLNIIENLKIRNDDKITTLVQENENNLDKMNASHIKSLKHKQSEDISKLDKRKLANIKQLNIEKSNKDQLVNDLETLYDELIITESDDIAFRNACDKYSDTLHQLIISNNKIADDLSSSIQHTEQWIVNNVPNYEKYQETLSSLNSDQNELLVDINKCKLTIAEFNSKIQENDKLLFNTEENKNQEILKLQASYEGNLRRLEIKSKYLKGVEVNLKKELELRLKEKCQLSTHLNKLLEEK